MDEAEERMDEAIENGLDYAIARKDTFWLLLFIGKGRDSLSEK